MPLLDMRTILFGNMITDIVCLLVILSLWRQSRKRFAGSGFWVFDFAFQTAAMFLIILRGRIPDLLSMVLSNTLVIGGAIMGYVGLRSFVGKKIPQVHNYLLLAVFALVHTYFTLVQPSLPARNLNVSTGLLIICFQCLWFLVYQIDPAMRRLTLGVGLVFGGYCLVSLGRITGFFAGAQAVTDFFQSGTFESLMVFSYQILFILLTYSLVLMVNKRLLVEVTTQEEKFAKAFHSSPYAITLTRLSDGQIIEVNDGFLNITGYQYAEAIGKTTVDLHLWDNEEDREVAIKELSKGGRLLNREFQFRKKSGETITGLFSADIIPINNQLSVISSINDITDRKRAEEELNRNREWLRVTLSSIGDGVMATDAEGRITFLNPVAATLTGWQREKALGQSIGQVFRIINEKTHEPAEDLVARVLNEKRVVAMANDTALITRKGLKIPIEDSAAPIHDASGGITGVVLVFHDVTQKRRAHEAILHAKQEWEQTFNTVPDLVAILDDQHRITRANKAMADRLGVNTEQCIGLRCYEAVHGTTEPPGFCPHRLTCQDGQQHFAEVYEPRLNGHFLVSTTPLRNLQGQFIGSAHIARDITERKQAEETLRKAHNELEKRVRERTVELSEAVQRLRTEVNQRQQLEATLRKSESQVRFFASQCLTAQETERKRVAGELHDSIAASLSALKIRIEKIGEGMNQGHDSPESLQELIPLVKEITKEVRRIMADLRPAVLDDLGLVAAMNWFCREYEKTYSRISVEKQIGISEEEVPDSLKTPIFRIFQEAMNNIAKYSRASGVNLSLGKENHKIQMTIRDNGQGFDRETIRKGMGLSTMRERAQLSGGTFVLESAVGKGTIIRAAWSI
ncbi:MAG: PAS domain S-box protein [Deltaproteobacteria bacterium]|nr:PAS domain S-box protein [Deltaproteobacteria bacterium]